MKTLEELKAIIAGKPRYATHHYFLLHGDNRISNYIDMDSCKWWDSTLCQWRNWGGVSDSNLRSISDIERIIELMEQVKSGYEAYARTEAIKQRYNGESKYKTNLLIDAERLLRDGSNQEHCNNLADVIKEALK